MFESQNITPFIIFFLEMNLSPIPIKIADDSFLLQKPEPPAKVPIEVCERNVSLLSDPSDLLYESLTKQIPEQILRARAYNEIGTKMTMPYPKREVN